MKVATKDGRATGTNLMNYIGLDTARTPSGGGNCMDAAAATMGALVCLGGKKNDGGAFLVGEKSGAACDQPSILCSFRHYTGGIKTLDTQLTGHFAVECGGSMIIDYTYGQFKEGAPYSPHVKANKPSEYMTGVDCNTREQAAEANSAYSFEQWLEDDCGSKGLWIFDDEGHNGLLGASYLAAPLRCSCQKIRENYYGR